MLALTVISRSCSPIELQDREITVSASIGISVYPHDGEDGETLLKNADTAMYHAKDQGRNCYAFFNGAISQRATRRFTLESSLRRAVEQGELRLLYQPRIDLRARQAIGMEALVRWPLPDGSCVMPAEFVPIAEETGLIQPLGEWVFHEACRQNVAWLRDSMPSLVVSVNLSTMQFKKKGFVRLIQDVLLKTGLDSTFLEIELTESLLIDDTPITKNIMASLQELGVRISIDDFGTGYSSLSYLKNFTFDALKLDQSLIQDVARSSSGAAIVKATIGLAHDLGLRIVAEGVEEQVQLDFLTKHGCDEAQGYLFAPPLESHEFETWSPWAAASWRRISRDAR
jgi:EAL domain-containing protein (putative c-di-GMP-specific phosphodiesterase class I)